MRLPNRIQKGLMYIDKLKACHSRALRCCSMIQIIGEQNTFDALNNFSGALSSAVNSMEKTVVSIQSLSQAELMKLSGEAENAIVVSIEKGESVIEQLTKSYAKIHYKE